MSIDIQIIQNSTDINTSNMKHSGNYKKTKQYF